MLFDLRIIAADVRAADIGHFRQKAGIKIAGVRIAGHTFGSIVLRGFAHTRRRRRGFAVVSGIISAGVRDDLGVFSELRGLWGAGGERQKQRCNKEQGCDAFEVFHRFCLSGLNAAFFAAVHKSIA